MCSFCNLKIYSFKLSPPPYKKIACPLSSRAALLHTLHRFSLLHIKTPLPPYRRVTLIHKLRAVFHTLFSAHTHTKNCFFPYPPPAAFFHSPPALFAAHSTPRPKANCPPMPPRRSLSLITRAVSRTFSLLPTKPTFHKRPHATLSLTAHAVSRAFPLQKQNRICRTSTAAPAHIHKPTAPLKYDKSDC